MNTKTKTTCSVCKRLKRHVFTCKKCRAAVCEGCLMYNDQGQLVCPACAE